MKQGSSNSSYYIAWELASPAKLTVCSSSEPLAAASEGLSANADSKFFRSSSQYIDSPFLIIESTVVENNAKNNIDSTFKSISKFCPS
jgi:hypothetical protein